MDATVDNEAPIPEPPGPTTRTTRQGTIDLTTGAMRNRRGGRRTGRGRGGQSRRIVNGESTGPRQAPERPCPYRYPYGQSVSVKNLKIVF